MKRGELTDTITVWLGQRFSRETHKRIHRSDHAVFRTNSSGGTLHGCWATTKTGLNHVHF